jgi:hypothetical protein
MANELRDDAYCGECRFYKKTGSILSGFCEKRKIATKENAVCGLFQG